MVYVLSHKGVKLNEYRAHSASVMTIEISDDGSEFIGTCSIDGPSGESRDCRSSVTDKAFYGCSRRQGRHQLVAQHRALHSFVCAAGAGSGAPARLCKVVVKVVRLRRPLWLALADGERLAPRRPGRACRWRRARQARREGLGRGRGTDLEHQVGAQRARRLGQRPRPCLSSRTRRYSAC